MDNAEPQAKGSARGDGAAVNRAESLVSGRRLYSQAEAYPPELQAAEQAALAARWRKLHEEEGQRLGEARKRLEEDGKLGVAAPTALAARWQRLHEDETRLEQDKAVKAANLPRRQVGLALSGGGIRSATFSLGVLQSLAKQELLGDVDFLSTVSGGGYAGGFWATWVNRLKAPSPWLGLDFKGAQALLADTDSPQVDWLRQNGRYLAPNGAGDEWLIATVLQRNFIALHLILAPLLLCGFSGLAAIPACWAQFHWQAPITVAGHPVVVAGDTLLLWALLAVAAPGAVLGVAFFAIGGNPGSVKRNQVTRYQAVLGQVFFALVAIGIVDLLGGSIYETAAAWLRGHTGRMAAGFGMTAAAILAALRWIKMTLLGSTAREGGPVPTSVWIALGAAALALGWMTTLATFAHFAVGELNWKATLGWEHWVPAAAFLVASLALSHFTSLLNGTSLASLYAARLNRAYLGASNEKRKDQLDITESVDGDEQTFADYFPHASGGPLHIVNVTINETMDPMSAVQRNDRKGVPMAVGPAGISVGAGHHALWVLADGKRTGQIVPTPAAPGQPDGFRVFDAPPGDPIKVEMLPMGAWIGVSGAAVSPGLGALTSLPFSLFLAFFNVRLGWWWDSGIRPRNRRPQKAQRPFIRVAGSIGAAIFKTQSYLFDEFTARFHGTARREWYLSDGGGFENTAAYELIRRRVAFIVICDNGADPERTGTDFANLVRKARIDFAADIEVLEPKSIPALPADLQPLIGNLDDLSSTARPSSSLPAKCVLLARVTYATSGEHSIVMLIKPTIRGTEPAPERNYSVRNQAFPQESTVDQFYGEDQWESYRALGEQIAGQLFAGRKLDAASFGLQPLL